MTDFAKIAADLLAIMESRGIEVKIDPIRQRTDGGWNDEYSHLRNHYRFTVSTKTKSHTGEYSKGCADLIKVVKKSRTYGPLQMWKRDKMLTLAILNGSRKLVDPQDGEWSEFMIKASKRVQPKPVDIVQSLLMDANGSDQDFEDWAGDLGYDSDSMTAHKAWETCNQSRRSMADMFGTDIDKAYNLASEF